MLSGTSCQFNRQQRIMEETIRLFKCFHTGMPRWEVIIEVLSLVFNYLIMLIWLIHGLFTFGILWPTVRLALFPLSLLLGLTMAVR